MESEFWVDPKLTGQWDVRQLFNWLVIGTPVRRTLLKRRHQIGRQAIQYASDPSCKIINNIIEF